MTSYLCYFLGNVYLSTLLSSVSPGLLQCPALCDCPCLQSTFYIIATAVSLKETGRWLPVAWGASLVLPRSSVTKCLRPRLGFLNTFPTVFSRLGSQSLASHKPLLPPACPDVFPLVSLPCEQVIAQVGWNYTYFLWPIGKASTL